MPQACNYVKYLYEGDKAIKKIISVLDSILHLLTTNKLRGLSPQANYTDRATAAFWLS
jgi:hypothetical protein